MTPDFITAKELAQLTQMSVGSIWNMHSSGRGPLAPILTKLGRHVGAWRSDYETWRAPQLRLPPNGQLAA